LDVNDPDNLVYQEGNTTYMLIPAETLPMVSWLAPFVSDERLAELDARYRPLVERDYDRPAYIPQGEGADWGNGTPPPSLQDPGAEQPVPDQTSTETVERESQSAGRVAGADETPAEESAGAEFVSVSESAQAAPAVDDVPTSVAGDEGSDIDETDLEAEVETEETASDQSAAYGTSETRATNESDDAEESADAEEADSAEGSDDATGSDKTGSDKTDSDKASSDSGGSAKTGD
ncbi:MAG: PE-PPE domain-containing protein, partial [Mycobacterium sp.]|nr:PE-PPE domain-containing protein [Mycobacterium sp.]